MKTHLIRDIIDLNGLYEQLAAKGEIPQGVLVAVGGVDRDFVLSLIGSSDGLYLAMDNCPHQMVLCGTAPGMQQAIEHLRTKGAVCLPLPFNRAYHTPLFQPFCERLRPFFSADAALPPGRDVLLYDGAAISPGCSRNSPPGGRAMGPPGALPRDHRGDVPCRGADLCRGRASK